MNGVFQNIEMNDKGRLIKSALLCYTICVAFGLRTSNILYLLFGGIFYIASKYEVDLEKRETIINRSLSFMFSIFMVLGNIDTILNADFLPWPLRVILCIFGFYYCFSFLIACILIKVRNVNLLQADEAEQKEIFKVFIFALIGLLCVLGIGLAISYPGNTTKDSNVFFRMVVGEQDMWAAISPIYILAIRFCWNLGIDWFGNVNAGVALFALIQIFIFSLIVSYLISRLYAHRINRFICFVIWLFYAIIPYNMQLSHTIWRDIPFSVCVFLLVVIVWDLYVDNGIQSKLGELFKYVILIIAATGICIFKGNGVFAYVFFLPFGIYLFWKRNKKVVVMLVVALAVARIVQGPVTDKIMTQELVIKNTILENGTEAEVTKKENATDTYNATGIYIVTIQQLARVVVDRTDLSEEDYLRLSRIIDVEKIREVYDPQVSDKAMSTRKRDVSTLEYLKEWLYFGFKYPVQYILAYKDQTLGYWYPDVQEWVYFNVTRENELGVYRDSFLSDEALEQMTEVEELYKAIPIYGLVWSIGFAVWITFFFMGVTYIKKGIREMFIYFPILGVWCTLLVAAPAYAEFRYIYSLFLCLPLSILLPFMNERSKKALGKSEKVIL